MINRKLQLQNKCFIAEVVEEPRQITEDEFMEVLTEQAREIAKAVLEQNPDAGVDLAQDAKVIIACTFVYVYW